MGIYSQNISAYKYTKKHSLSLNTITKHLV